jgi:uncharacterized protein YbjT (DUF2867 family)
VLGATGSQGSSVVDALLASGEFKVRGITRDSKSEKAQALAKKGVEVVEGNVVEPASLKQALTGAYGFFAVTDAWNQEQAKKGEDVIGKSLVDVAKEAKVTHYIWSTLPNAEQESKGKYKNIPHFTNKEKVDEYIKKEGGFPYVTFVLAPFYFQNWGTFFQHKVNSDGSVSYNLPVKEDWHLIHGDIDDIGAIVTNAFKNPKDWGNRDYIGFGHKATWREVFQTFEKNWGVKVTLNTVPQETWDKLPFPGAEELREMFEFFEEYGVFGRTHELNGAKAKGSSLKTWDEWLKEGRGPKLPSSTSSSGPSK